MAETDQREEVEIPVEMEQDYINTQKRIMLLREELSKIVLQISWEKESFYKRYGDSVE